MGKKIPGSAATPGFHKTQLSTADTAMIIVAEDQIINVFHI